MQFFRRVALAGLLGGLLVGSVSTASADDRAIFAGCVTARTETTVTLDTSAKERITIDTTWLKPAFRDILTADCLTFTTVMVDGKYMAESVEQGDEPNEVHSLTNETTSDREMRSEKEDDDKDSGGNSD
jgi:hypothetical protein